MIWRIGLRSSPGALLMCRYNEALVLLGEKSERVEELQMDIVDLKEGYQHALQRLVGGK